MGRYITGSQSKELLAEKERIAIRLIEQGLTTNQIAGQLRCSAFFVRRIRRTIERGSEDAT